jgi:hypothetical protein
MEKQNQINVAENQKKERKKRKEKKKGKNIYKKTP